MADEEYLIDISGLDKAHVLAHIYYNSTPRGTGRFVDNVDDVMTLDEARKILQSQTKFDYLKGRLLKIDLTGDLVDSRKYDHNYGFGALRDLIFILKPAEAEAEAEYERLIREFSGDKTRLIRFLIEHIHSIERHMRELEEIIRKLEQGTDNN